MCVYSPIPRARDTPLFFRYPLVHPLPIPGSRATPAAETTAPAPELLNRPSQPEPTTGIAGPEEEMHRIDTATAEAQQQQRKYLIAT